MHWLTLMVLAWYPFADLGGTAEKGRTTYHFTKRELGRVPDGWKVERTGTGQGSVWKVVADPTAPAKAGYVLAQTAAGPKRLFNLCILQAGRYRDVELSVAFKAVKGDEDQGGGLVWRYQDADNYHVARMNPLEDNYRFYKVVAGKRTQLATREGVKVAAGTWHTLKVRQVGDRVRCFLDGKQLLDATDTTFTGAGKVGVWTKADAQTEFAAFQVEAVDGKGR